MNALAAENRARMIDFMTGGFTAHDTLTESLNEAASEPDSIGDLYTYLKERFFDPFVAKMPDYSTNDVSEYPEFARFRHHLIMVVLYDNGPERLFKVA